MFVSPFSGLNLNCNCAIRNLAPASLLPVRQPPCSTVPQLSQTERSIQALFRTWLSAPARISRSSGAGQTPARDAPSVHRLESLDSSAPVGLGHINIAFRIDRHGMAMGEFADLMTRTPEA